MIKRLRQTIKDVRAPKEEGLPRHNKTLYATSPTGPGNTACISSHILQNRYIYTAQVEDLLRKYRERKYRERKSRERKPSRHVLSLEKYLLFNDRSPFLKLAERKSSIVCHPVGPLECLDIKQETT